MIFAALMGTIVIANGGPLQDGRADYERSRRFYQTLGTVDAKGLMPFEAVRPLSKAEAEALQSLRAGKWSAARTKFGAILKNDPSNWLAARGVAESAVFGDLPRSNWPKTVSSGPKYDWRSRSGDAFARMCILRDPIDVGGNRPEWHTEFSEKNALFASLGSAWNWSVFELLAAMAENPFHSPGAVRSKLVRAAQKLPASSHLLTFLGSQFIKGGLTSEVSLYGQRLRLVRNKNGEIVNHPTFVVNGKRIPYVESEDERPNFSKAVDYCDKAITLDKRLSAPHYIKAAALARLGRIADAKRSAAQYLKLAKHDEQGYDRAKEFLASGDAKRLGDLYWSRRRPRGSS